MEIIIQTLNENSGFVMAILTLIYVIATICICVANFKSVKETQKQADESKRQLEESKRQYEDKKRIEIKPYILLEVTQKAPINHILTLNLDNNHNLYDDDTLNYIKIKNYGNGSAKSIEYDYQLNTGEKYDRGPFPIQGLSSGELQNILLKFYYLKQNDACKKCSFYLRYEDLLENSYTQKVTFIFEFDQGAKLTSFKIVNDPPVLVEKENTNA